MNKPTKHPFGDTEYQHFEPTHAICDPDTLRLATDLGEKPNLTAFDLNRENLNNDLMHILKSLGFRRISTRILSGTFAFVIEANNHQMIRIVNKEYEGSRWKDPIMLQPIKTINLRDGDEYPRGCYEIEILPKLHTLYDVMNDEKLREFYGLKDPKKDAERFIQQLVIDSHAKGYFFYDCSLSNIGLVKNAQGKTVPLILDPGAVVVNGHIQDQHYKQFSTQIIRGVDTAFRNLFPDVPKDVPYSTDIDEQLAQKLTDCGKKYREYLRSFPCSKNPPYADAQTNHLAALGLEKEKVKGVVPLAQLKRFDSERSGYSGKVNPLHPGGKYAPSHAIYPNMVREDGLYPGEIGRIIKQAIINFEAEQKAKPVEQRSGFCDHIRRIRGEQNRSNSGFTNQL